MSLAKAIGLKIASALLFALMQALVRWLGDAVPLGQVVFFRAAFAILPVIIIFAWRRELLAAVMTNRPAGHLLRGLISVVGMFLNFAALARLPLVDATAISFAAPLITVAFAAWFLGERVRIYRWSAVTVGFVGVLVMLWPHFDLNRLIIAGSATTAVGAICALGSAFTNAGAVIQTRILTKTETTSSIVFYFSLICAVGGLATLPLGWIVPSAAQLAALIALGVLGGLAHILLTESYRYASASVVAPFDYTTMLWAFLLGYAIFGEVPTLYVLVGAVIVTGAGLFVLWRERQLGLKRVREAEGPPTAG
ncbi:MAG TPA: DMT family transporter [Xanthobacteraceae bacterium]|nr:DMT family transporter [Xanthobacteraceae bacterium]